MRERLWQEKHGDSDGLSDYLNEIYEKQLHAIARPRVAARKNAASAKVVLCELFTGSECPPCVAADVATTALETTYAESEVIVLRYHQHIPAPDPLANDASDERFSSYDLQGTPALYVNGKDFSGAGGFLEQVADIYGRLLKTIEPILAEDEQQIGAAFAAGERQPRRGIVDAQIAEDQHDGRNHERHQRDELDDRA